MTLAVGGTRPPTAGFTCLQPMLNHRSIRLVHMTTLALACVFGLGCYTFAETSESALVPGTTVRVTLDDEEALRQRTVHGRVVSAVRGEVLTVAGDSVHLLVRASGADGRDFNQTQGIPRSAITRVEAKRFDLGRTAALAGVAAAAGAAALIIDSGGTDPGAEPPPTSELIWSLLRLMLPGH